MSDDDIAGQKLLTKIMVTLEKIDGKFNAADIVQRHNDETLGEIKDDIKDVKDAVKDLGDRLGEIEIQLRGDEPGVSIIVELKKRVGDLEKKDTKAAVSKKMILGIMAGVWAVIQLLTQLLS